jgi:heptaprenyl diphosphate synthase
MLQLDLLGSNGLQIPTSDLARVERGLKEATATRFQFLTMVCSHISSHPGKRLRPILTLMSASAFTEGSEASPAAIDSAVAVEMLHLGSIYHDDVIDETTVRRGVSSTNACWSNTAAVLGGDILLARAVKIAASLGSVQSRIVADALEELCTGQALETDGLGQLDRGVSHYFDSINGKTAALIAASCMLGCAATSASPERTMALASFGRSLGQAFQVIDDLLDLVGSPTVLGKPVGTDLSQGVITLPVIYAMQEKRQILEALAAGDVKRAREEVLTTSGLARAAKDAQRLARDALCHIQDARLGAGHAAHFEELVRLLIQNVLRDHLETRESRWDAEMAHERGSQ